jgi:hypothetical protein
MRRTREELSAVFSSTAGVNEAQFRAAQAELEMLDAEEHLAILQQTQANVAAMNSEILRFREVVDAAAKAGEKTSRALLSWTRVLAFATVGLVAATAALVYATLRCVR